MIDRRGTGRSDRGVTLVTFALSLVGIFAVIVLVLGGSLGYTAERNSQTASDVAALAATTKLRNLQTGEAGVVAADIRLTAESVAQDNDADVGAVGCFVVEWDLDEIGPCTDANIASPNASGVRVLTSDTRSVPFGEVTGSETIRGATVATATIQPVVEGQSPFMICSPAAAHSVDILIDSGGGDWSVNPSAEGEIYVLHGNPIKEGGRDCGNPDNSWRGLVEFDKQFSLPGWWGVENGNKNGHMPRLLTGTDACGGQGVDVNDYIGCEISVPLCVNGNGSNSNFELYCVGIGRFEIVWNGNGPSMDIGGVAADDCWEGNQKHICGRFLGGGIANSGQGGQGPADPSQVAVIKLVE